MIACSLQSRTAGEPITGTAPFAPAWLLVEEPGPWPSRSPGAVASGRSDADAMAALSDRFDGLPVRLQWIRPVGRVPGVQSARRVYLVHPRDPATGADGWIERLEVADAGELAQLDHDVLLADQPPGMGRPEAGVLVTVCTHAKKDACCAANGRPVAAALAAAAPTFDSPVTVLETTHLGGHRFAATFAILPEGVLYGRATPADALDIVRRSLQGEITVTHLRGRAALDRWGQVAERTVRERLRLPAAAVRIGPTHASEDRHTVVCTTPDGSYAVDMVERPLGATLLLGCRKDTLEDPGQVVVLGLESLGTDRTVASPDYR